ncbi:leucine-rich repeats and immunoglobulin-like domains protein 2 [Anneissia japonica]|uniref:leucine-rich repeats and immunoglobulin-like domains protein 2 n=1 Tax=Anneissia japonica TaxID=1529436 RepID=UPI0014257A45|nr:leucine-rich repeats and immunoglobulin-like domains protein 2 [Anneissia japonica]
MVPNGIIVILILYSIFGCYCQDCSLVNICYKSEERILDRFQKSVCVCPYAPCIPLSNPCPGYLNIQFDGIATGTSLPAGIFKEWGDLNAISIHQGPPVNITKELFQSQRPHLTILELDTFSIEHIDVGAFEGFRNLEFLDIRPFKINIIRRNTFRGLNSLRVLKLYSGNLTVVESGAFNGLSNLKRLWLSNNHIDRIQKGLFDNLVQLEELKLSFNKIHHIDPFAFSKLSNLHTLECWDTKLRKLSPEMLDGLKFIKKLNFGKNMISRIETGTFAEMPYLEHLLLSKNNLTTFSLIDLHLPLPGLMTLDLQFNQIEDILFPTNTKEPLLANLTKFILNRNQLGAVPRFILDYAPVMSSGFAPVPISCECFEVTNATNSQDSINLVPSMSCPQTCFLPTIDCTPSLVELKSLWRPPTIIITCNVTGNPTPSVTWKRPNGRVILGDYNPWEGVTNLYISNIELPDTGKYVCQVENTAGTAQSSTSINFLESAAVAHMHNLLLLWMTTIILVIIQ